MSVRSMTGFARARGTAGPDRAAEIVVRSVNSRFLDLTVKTRESEAALEPILRRIFSKHVHRGKVEVSLRLQSRVVSVSRSRPLNRIAPVSLPGGSGIRRRIDMAVTDLPQPLSPTMARVSPASTWKDTPSTARLMPSGLWKCA